MSPIHHLGKSKKRMGERLCFVTFRLKCFVWTDKDGGGPYEGFGFASDVSEEGVGIFLDRLLPKATPVSVALEDETNAPYRGLVIWGQHYSLQQRFHAQANLEFRAGIQFLFDSESERQRYLMYYNDLRKRATSVPNQFKF